MNDKKDLNNGLIIGKQARSLLLEITDVNSYRDGKLYLKDGEEPYIIEQNSYIKLDNYTYFIKDILQSSKLKFYLIVHPINKTSTFIVPFFGKNKVSMCWNNFCTSAIDSPTLKSAEKHLYLLYRSTMNPSFITFEKKILSHPNFVEMVQKDSEHVLFKLTLDNKYKSDIDNILSGKYSKISKNAKNIILKFHGFGKESREYGILYKTDIWKKKLSDLLSISKADLSGELLGEFMTYDINDVSNADKRLLMLYSEILT